MNFFNFRSKKKTQVQQAPVAKHPALNGWTERDVVSVYNAAPVRHLRQGDVLFADVQGSDAFFVVLEGRVEVVVKWDARNARPAVFGKGDCIAPLSKSPGLT